MLSRVMAFGIVVSMMSVVPVDAAELSALLKTLSHMEGAGNNNPAATTAWNELTRTAPEK